MHRQTVWHISWYRSNPLQTGARMEIFGSRIELCHHVKLDGHSCQRMVVSSGSKDALYILIDQTYIHADETTVQVLKEKGKKNTSKSYMWVYATHKYSKTPIRLFDYQPNRKGAQAKEYLKGFSGILITDAYAGYDQIPGVDRCYCWAHLRRYFADALPKDLDSKHATYPRQAIEKLQKIFHEEALLEDLDTEKRQKKRNEIQAPMVEDFFAWIDINKDKVLGASKCGKAFHYALNQKAGLIKYLEDGNIPMTNSIAERAIRPFTIGRKNWLFNGVQEEQEPVRQYTASSKRQKPIKLIHINI